MLRSNGDYGKVRKGDRLSLSDSTVNSTKTWGRKGYVFGVSLGNPNIVLSSRQKQSDFQGVRSRRGTGESSFLVKVSRQHQMFNFEAVTRISSFGFRGRRNVRRLAEKKRANWEIAPASWAATGTTGQIPVLVARTGTTLPRTRTTTSGGGACVATSFYRSANATALQADLSKCGQPDLSSFGEYTARFGITSSTLWKSGADF